MFPRVFALVASLMLIACGSTSFTTSIRGETTVEGDPTPVLRLFDAVPGIGSFTGMDFDANEDFQNNGVTKDQVRSVTVESFELKIVDPTSQDFSFMNALTFSARAGDLEEVVAQKENIPDGQRSPLVLDLTGAELRPYVTAPTMSLVVRGNGSVPPQDTRIQAEVVLEVVVGLL
jgi:hypothetical protein